MKIHKNNIVIVYYEILSNNYKKNLYQKNYQNLLVDGEQKIVILN